jgi:hypothetical protein
MRQIYLVALMAVSAVSVPAESASVSIQPSADTIVQRQALRNLSACLAKSRTRWARETLSHPYLSEAQVSSASEALVGRDTCVQGDVEVTLRTSGLVGSLAEYFLRADLSRVSPERLSKVLSTLDPLNGSEDFALCVASASH